MDPEAFSAALRDGIGRAKAYGCGLLSLARAS
ncbi:type I-E CRISPR-associated protein Cas6/Cse3/CasE [Streptoalloteichus tenebrarius]|nr:type I-E CRISPR-associated protein Cas6/Cse3/CasE [Streptoalloteichus tenebrarius]